MKKNVKNMICMALMHQNTAVVVKVEEVFKAFKVLTTICFKVDLMGLETTFKEDLVVAVILGLEISPLIEQKIFSMKSSEIKIIIIIWVLDNKENKNKIEDILTKINKIKGGSSSSNSRIIEEVLLEVWV